MADLVMISLTILRLFKITIITVNLKTNATKLKINILCITINKCTFNTIQIFYQVYLL